MTSSLCLIYQDKVTQCTSNETIFVLVGPYALARTVNYLIFDEFVWRRVVNPHRLIMVLVEGRRC